MQARAVPAVSTRIAGLVDLFRSPSKPGTNNSIPTNSSVASLLIDVLLNWNPSQRKEAMSQGVLEMVGVSSGREGVLAPNHRWRGLVTPAKRGKGAKRLPNKEVASPAERHAAMTWAQRLKRVFSVDIEVCGRCGGSLKVIACIEDQDIIDRILAHLREKEQEAPARPLLVPPTRAPPATLSLFAGSEFQTPHQQRRH